ncbi:autotransporter outer membrane beta-barrel domain-containing protein [Bradyrhizobium sp. 170]|uniref:autotransporter outer membrane beta-barrel domain-containing protein n=1 Tax=Bradyrhizobium sp. 170 TaxID=2782641 RepID=UPI001FFFF111|nr:autotransporter outer membrane beta-barrel domain-containing protein [Bradyrhizobium sp. 170]UPK00623.1 autotransporter outer membrane beta-barrel domain-containing protein [Bradyrhizobium sp. 170]
MRCSSRLWRARKIGTGGALARLVAIAFVLIGIMSAAQAQSPTPTPTPTPTPSPTPSPTPTVINSTVSSGAAVTNLGSNFLERLGNQSSNGFNRLQRTNPGGGGASENTEAPRYRTWFEGYGNHMKTGAIGDFVGDSRKTWGGVAGIGARVAPGINIGFSVDQSRSAIDIPLALQSATIDLTQIGFTASVDSGPWTWASAVVHGFGNINSLRDTGLGIATAGYSAKLDGVLSEISYYWTRDQGRIVPKAAFEYVRAQTGSLQEIGGLDPVTATGATVQRGRLLIGAELGHYWIFDGKIFDLSGYGKFVDNVVQNFSDITVSQGVQSITFQGIGESRYGLDTGASASLSLTNTARLYVNYDAKLRAAMQSHQGTVGLEFKW